MFCYVSQDNIEQDTGNINQGYISRYSISKAWCMGCVSGKSSSFIVLYEWDV